MKKFIIIACLLIAVSGMAQQVERGTVLIKNGTVLTITQGVKENTDVLIKDGKISQIGKNLAAPAGAKVIDATGYHVMPGIIDAHS
ncbi:MAG TPA: amidohydrolase, partial [Cyclobacteriaceae bacterium]|nr:amidohydrolase [Cyclobacteriaceae bacterium]